MCAGPDNAFPSRVDAVKSGKLSSAGAAFGPRSRYSGSIYSTNFRSSMMCMSASNTFTPFFIVTPLSFFCPALPVLCDMSPLTHPRHSRYLTLEVHPNEITRHRLEYPMRDNLSDAPQPVQSSTGAHRQPEKTFSPRSIIQAQPFD